MALLKGGFYYGITTDILFGQKRLTVKDLVPDLWDFVALRAGISADGCKGSEAWGNYHSWNRQWTDLVCNGTTGN